MRLSQINVTSFAPQTPSSNTHKSIPRNNSIPILPDSQVLPPLHTLNHQPLLVRQVQQANEPKTRADVQHLLLGVDVLEVVHDVDEVERVCFGLGEGGRCGVGGGVGLVWGRDGLVMTVMDGGWKLTWCHCFESDAPPHLLF